MFQAIKNYTCCDAEYGELTDNIVLDFYFRLRQRMDYSPKAAVQEIREDISAHKLSEGGDWCFEFAHFEEHVKWFLKSIQFTT